MSVIFEALRKVRQPQDTIGEPGIEEKRSANVYTVKDLVFSPQGLLGLILVALLVGVAAYYGEGYISSLRHVGRPAREVGPKKIVIPPQHDKATQASELREEPGNEVPPPPKDVSYETPQPGKLYLPPKKEAGQPVKEVPASSIQYFPPKKEGQSRGSESAIHEVSRPPKNTLIEVSNRGYKDDLPAVIDANKSQDSRVEETFEPAFSPQQAKRDTSFGRRRQLQGHNSVPSPLRTEEVQKIPDNRKALRKPEHRASLAARAQEKESKERTARISWLVSRIQGAMTQNDKAKVDELLPKLIHIKGKDDPFVLKLQAFWHIKQGRYDSAKKLLIKVLGRDPKDLEAGLNMAIIEIKTGKLDKARKRLKVLRDLYEDSNEVPELLRKING
ncbi:MAG: hypothetical protein DRG76_00630 [Deltaproteobacteria bacterium]|nr:MAG: hypothetical protein DRG76_00630 [Deltaproteobacteria bacterium]